MKKIVWKNKSNNQLCITIPKSSNIKEGDLVDIQKTTIKKIAYSGVVADLFHYGHLYSLQFGKSISDYNIIGVLTDEAVEKYRTKPIANLKERKAVLESLNCVDRVMIQNNRDHTENIKKIHQEFPEAEIILVHGDDLKKVPGTEYLKKINGRLAKHPYYKRLSTFKIIQKIIENKDKFKDMATFSSLIKGENKIEGKEVIISSKTNTLKALQPLLKESKIERLYDFTISDWKNKKQEVIDSIKTEFSPSKIVVRSSAVNEDTLDNSMAGCFESILNVDSSQEEEIEKAIKKVIDSYKKKQAESSFNQILVQKQTQEIVMSGVIFTRTLEKNAPYYVINYDDQTGSTDSVTAGRENKSIIISHFTSTLPEKIRKLIKGIKELEKIIPKIPLDIEFAINKNSEVIIFQVRPLAVNIHKEQKDKEIKEKLDRLKAKFRNLMNKLDHLSGKTTVFADMPDWNPAEIIGNNPNHLDYSLYDYIITNKAWHQARTSQGHCNVNPAKLVELFGNKPYVNVRNSANSFIPASLSFPIKDKLVSFYLNKLKKNPHLQDKVEFEVYYTCYDLSFEERAKELYEEGFSEEEVKEIKSSLIELTNNLVMNSPHTIEEDMKEVFSMEESREFIKQKIEKEKHTPKELIDNAKILLDECWKKGTVQFSRLARLGFIAKIILKSLVKKEIIDHHFYNQLFNSLSTVATKINQDFKRLIKGEFSKADFLKEYYHLRPGTYDITSLRYDSNPNLIQSVKLDLAKEEKTTFELDQNIVQKIDKAFKKEGLSFDALSFLNFIKAATEARELSKFEFTKNLSDALELIAKAGEKMGFTRKELAFLDINDLFRINLLPNSEEITYSWKELIKEKELERETQEKLVLPPLIFSEKDFDIVEPYTAKPNFITQKSIAGKLINIDKIGEDKIPEIKGNIVILENGDPGYDWIFTRNPAGLITKYGGVASHMSIRCAEFGIPAAIGCGEIIFDKIKNSNEVLLDCRAGQIKTH